MTAEGWKAVGEFIGLLVIIAQGYFAMKQRQDASVKMNEIQATALKTHDAVNGSLGTVVNELATTSRALATATGTIKDDERARANERSASDHRAEGPK
jgi:hypothetical protein